MILVDMGLAIAQIMGESQGSPSMDVNIIRHSLVNMLRTIRSKNRDAGEMVLCYDSANPWRKGVFANYKASRKKGREDSAVDWNKLFEILQEIKREFAQNMPYKVMCVDNCEADDIIAVLTKRLHTSEKILIVSSDGDFQQLQQFPGVVQYSPIHKKQIKCDNPHKYLFEHTMRGDVGDGIPNILSDDDCFINDEKRQRSLYQKRLDLWWSSKNFDDLSPEHKSNIQRNKTLIDFSFIPEEIENRILDQYTKTIPPRKSKLMDYFIDKNLVNFVDELGDF